MHNSFTVFLSSGCEVMTRETRKLWSDPQVKARQERSANRVGTVLPLMRGLVQRSFAEMLGKQ